MAEKYWQHMRLMYGLHIVLGILLGFCTFLKPKLNFDLELHADRVHFHT